MMNPKAFTLIEVIVYIALVTLFALITFRFTGSVRQHIEQMRLIGKHHLANALALDVIKRDLVSAVMQRSLWDIQQGIFTKSVIDDTGKIIQRCVGWCVVEHGLQRYEGIYDFVKQRWTKRTGSFFGCTMSNLSFNAWLAQDPGFIEYVQISYIQQGTKITPGHAAMQHEYVRLRNRVLA